MSPRKSIPIALSLVVLVLALIAAPAHAEGTPDAGAGHYANGYAALKQGNIDEAAKHFLAAAKAVPTNQTYVQQALGLRKVQGLRRYVAKNDLSPKWTNAARSLHLFYLQNGLGSLAVEIDAVAHQRMQSADSALWLAEAYLETGQNAEATALLAPYANQSTHLAAYHALALARLGRLDDARRVAQRAVPADDAEPAVLFSAARLNAVLGQTPQALAYLKTSFERTPTAALPYSKTRAQASPDLASLTRLPAFAEVLKTESQVKETCSGGSSCSSCPNRGSCGK